MNDTYKKLIFVIASLAILAAAYFFGYRNIEDKTNTLKAECTTLKNRYDDLMSKEVNRQQYIDDTKRDRELYKAKLDEFPSFWSQSEVIEYEEHVHKDENVIYRAEALAMSAPSQFYSVGGSNSEGTLAVTDNGEEGAAVVATNYECYEVPVVISYYGTYEGIKKFMDRASSFPYRVVVDSVTIKSEDLTGVYVGNMNMIFYFVTGPDRDQEMEYNVDDVQTGVDNLFAGGEGTEVSKFAADNGDAIKSDYDLFVAVNPADSDTSGKSVSLKSGGSNVTSSKNEAESISVKITQDGTTYTVEYGIGTEKQLQEFDPGDDLTLLIQSSDIKDSSDLNSISVTLENTSDKTLYVKVAGDDTANRVKIANRSGSVVVYR